MSRKISFQTGDKAFCGQENIKDNVKYNSGNHEMKEMSQAD